MIYQPGDKCTTNNAIVKYIVAHQESETSPLKCYIVAYWHANGCPWICWRVNENGDTYWGRYFDTEEDALKCMMKRAEESFGLS